MLSRGLPLPPRGSPLDRIQREMVWRERAERVAHLRAIGQMVGTLFNMNTDKIFASVYREYAREVFQEDYNADSLEKRAKALRTAQQRVRGRRLYDVKMLQRLDLMGQWADREFGPDLKPLPKERRKKRNDNGKPTRGARRR